MGKIKMLEMITNNYSKAFVEVEAVLGCLEGKEYDKIPEEIRNIIKENKDGNYIYEYDKDDKYKNWNLMPETKAILYNILKDYLANEEQRTFLEQKEKFERNRLEKIKRERYNPNDIFKKRSVIKNKF